MKRLDLQELLEVRESLEVQELRERIDEILHMLEGRETVEVIDHGKVIAHLVPVSEPKQSDKRDVYAFWRKIDQLAAQVGTHLPEKVDAVQIIREGTREL
jgi:antitoxin (DNA-binding transcriptional repressor) of toxin-antitoxin stability system